MGWLVQCNISVDAVVTGVKQGGVWDGWFSVNCNDPC